MQEAYFFWRAWDDCRHGCGWSPCMGLTQRRNEMAHRLHERWGDAAEELLRATVKQAFGKAAQGHDFEGYLDSCVRDYHGEIAMPRWSCAPAGKA